MTEIKPIYSIIDLFSGSGVVSRLFKSLGYNTISNDLELYAKIINECYLANPNEFNLLEWQKIKQEIDAFPKVNDGIISRLYAPADTNNIQPGERAFYTRENAILIDTIRTAIDKVCPENYRKYFLGPLLSEASIHVNTSGVFKGFYKDKNTGIGKFGGTGSNALGRIMSPIELRPPILSEQTTKYQIYQADANALASEISADVAYLDPPYNQHPYGSNYFMLNIIAKNQEPDAISRVSGIATDWNRSAYNQRANIGNKLDDVINKLSVRYILLSYNNEGFLSYNEIVDMLEQYGDVSVLSTQYNTFRGCRNLENRDPHVIEYLFLLKKF